VSRRAADAVKEARANNPLGDADRNVLMRTRELVTVSWRTTYLKLMNSNDVKLAHAFSETSRRPSPMPAQLKATPSSGNRLPAKLRYSVPMDWDDLKIILAVARLGSLSAAARAPNHTTDGEPQARCIRA